MSGAPVLSPFHLLATGKSSWSNCWNNDSPLPEKLGHSQRSWLGGSKHGQILERRCHTQPQSKTSNEIMPRNRSYAAFFLATCLLLLFLEPVAGQNRICSSLAVCVDELGLATGDQVVDGRALTCPASDCDGTGILEHHLQDENLGASAGCTVSDNLGFITTQENGFMRCFAGVCSSSRIINSVSFRVQRLEGTSTPITVNLFRGTSASCDSSQSVIALYNQAPMASFVQTLGTGINYLATVPIPGNIVLAPTESLLVEIKAPSLAGMGQFFVADSSDQFPTQCDPSYLQSPNCPGIANPTAVSTLGDGFAPVSFIITVNTSPASSVPGPPIPTPNPPTFNTPPAPTFARPTLPSPTPPSPVTSEGCFGSIFQTAGCFFNYLLGWLTPF